MPRAQLETPTCWSFCLFQEMYDLLRSCCTLQKRFYPEFRIWDTYRGRFCPCLNRDHHRMCRDFPKMEALNSSWNALDMLLLVWPVDLITQRANMTQLFRYQWQRVERLWWPRGGRYLGLTFLFISVYIALIPEAFPLWFVAVMSNVSAYSWR